MHEQLKELVLLYVEDEDDIRTQMARFLSKKVKQVHLARNGQEGATLFAAHSPDIVITDIRMPISDGVSMVEEIRRLSATTPVIFITACDEESGLLQPDTPVSRTIQKPINVMDLLVLIEELAKKN